VEAKPNETRLELDFEEHPISGANRWIELAAIMPLPKGRFALPRVRAEAVLWQGETATVLISAPLLLEQLNIQNGRQTKTGVLPAPAVGETAEMQLYSPEARVELSIARRSDDLQIAEGTAFTISGREMLAETVLDAHASQGDRFELQPEVPRQWIVDAVDTIPSGGISDWSVEEREAEWQPLTIRLKQALRPNRPIKLLLQSRWRKAPLGEAIGLTDLRLWKFATPHPPVSLIELKTTDSFQFKLTNADELGRLDLQQLNPDELALFRVAPAGTLFRDDPINSVPLQVELSPRAARYDAQSQVTATVLDQQLNEKFVFRIAPKGGPVEMVRIEFPRSHAAQLQWSLASSNASGLTARLLNSEERRSAGLSENGEIWELRLPQARSAPFELEADGTRAWDGPVAVNLPTLPAAETQQGIVTVEQRTAPKFWLENRRLKLLATEPLAASRSPGTAVTFQFDPAADAQAGDPPLLIQPQSQESEGAAVKTPLLPPAWCWLCQYDARLGATGSFEHRATYFLENTADGALNVSLPVGCRLIDVFVSGRALEKPLAGDNRSLVVPLLATQRYPVVTISYASPASGALLAQRFQPLVPQINVPVLRTVVTAWVPAAADAWSSTPAEGERFSGDLSWSQRIFGPFGRPREESRFEPWKWSAWEQTLPRIAGGAQTGATLQRLLPQWTVAAAQSEGIVTWGSALQLFSAALSHNAPPRRLLIDRWALEQEGLTPATVLNIPPIESDADRAVVMLSQARLVFLVTDEAVVLTSARQAVAFAGQFAAEYRGVTARIQPGPLAESIREAAGDSNLSEAGGKLGAAPYCSLDTWQALSKGPSPWSAGQAQISQGAPNFGWRPYNLAMSNAGTPLLWIVNHHARQTISWALFLLAAASMAWRKRSRSAVALAVSAAALLAALWLPAIFAPFFTAIFWGLAVGRGFAWLRTFGAAPPDDGHSAVRMAAPLAAGIVTALALLACGCWLSAARAEEGATGKPAHGDAFFRVFIPVDDKQQPVGDLYYIPATLYQELERRTQAGGGELGDTPDWTCESAEYSGSLVRDAANVQLALLDLKAVYQIRTARAKTRVAVPWGGSGAQLLSSISTLDDRPLQILREKDEGDLLVDVASAGPHRLELHWRPALRSGQRDSGFDLNILPAATSQLRLAAPADSAELRFPNARGRAYRPGPNDGWSVQLGPIPRLSVRWNDASGALASEPVVQADELAWLKILPGSAVLDLKYKLTVKEGRLREFRVATDSRLRLLPAAVSDQYTVSQVDSPGSGPPTIRFQFARPVRDAVTVEATLLLTGTPVVGNLHFPVVRPQGVTAATRLLAVSVDPGLRYDQVASNQSPSLPIADFLTAWGAADAKPAFCRRLPPPEIDWNIALRPQEPTMALKEQYAWFLGSGRAHLDYGVNLSTTGSHPFQYRLQVPDNFSIDSISVREDETELPIRWARSAPNRVTVFLPAAAANDQALAVAGSLPCPANQKWSFPALHVEHGQIASTRAFVFRQPDVLVDAVHWNQLAQETASDALLTDALAAHWLEKTWVKRARLVGVWQGTEPAAGDANLSNNTTQVEVTQLIALQHEEDAWHATLDCDLHISGGKLDVFRFEVPNDWSGPFEVDLPAQVEVRPLPGDEKKLLVLRPKAPWQNAQRFTIRGPLQEQDHPRLPDVVPLHASRVTRLVALPALLNLHHLAWDVRNLGPIAWPRTFQDFPGRESYALFRADGEHVDAVLKTAESLSGTPRVALADYVLRYYPDGCRGLARFDLFPVGLNTCVLTLPEPWHLLSITVNGAPAILRASGTSRWDLAVGPSPLPQRIEVTFFDPHSHWERGAMSVAGPALADLSVEQTLWTISAAGLPGELRLSEGSPLSPLRKELSRLVELTNVLEAALQSAAHEAPAAPGHWATSWLQAGAITQRRLEQWRMVEPRGSLAKIESDVQIAEQNWAKLAKRALGTDAAPAEVDLDALAATPELGPEPRDPALSNTVSFAKGTAKIAIFVAPTKTAPFAAQIGYWLLTAAGLALALALYRSRRLWPLVERYPAPLAALVSLAWWLWLSPSALGLVLAACCLLANFGFGRRVTRHIPAKSF
jgi:hypothetical protein